MKKLLIFAVALLIVDLNASQAKIVDLNASQAKVVSPTIQPLVDKFEEFQGGGKRKQSGDKQVKPENQEPAAPDQIPFTPVQNQPSVNQEVAEGNEESNPLVVRKVLDFNNDNVDNNSKSIITKTSVGLIAMASAAVVGVTYFAWKFFKKKENPEDKPYNKLVKSLKVCDSDCAREALKILEDSAKDIPNKRYKLLCNEFVTKLNKEQEELVSQVYKDWLQF